jgi:hypothetical protein
MEEMRKATSSLQTTPRPPSGPGIKAGSYHEGIRAEARDASSAHPTARPLSLRPPMVDVSEPASKLVAQENRTEVHVEPTPRKKRGRPTEIPDDLKRRALTARGGKARAQILYRTKYPTAQQVKNVWSILRHYRGKCTPGQG